MSNRPSDNRLNQLTAEQVLRRYEQEDLLTFSGVRLTSVDHVGRFGERPLKLPPFAAT
jgi:hypothetical protein